MSTANGGAEIRSYHGQPVIKEPIWSWEIPCYFFTGGLAGASAGFAYLSQLRGEEVLARRVWAIALLGAGASPALLISDLGRPMRFINMLRMFKITSPMNVGSWILSAGGTSIAIAATHAWTGTFPRAARLARPAAAVLGLPLCTYTAALVSNTAVPAWHEAHRLLPTMFASGAALSAGAAAVVATPPAHAGPARRLVFTAAACELIAKELMERRLGELAEPYKKGVSGRFSLLARACVVPGTALLATRGAHSRRAAMAAGALICAGALSRRWSVFKAGATSASDPKYVIAPHRERIERGGTRGGARTEPRVAAADPKLGSPATVR